MKKFIELSMPIEENTVVYPGDPATTLTRFHQHERDGMLDSVVSTSLHSSTHIDAPKHFFAKGASIDSYPASRFACRGWVVNCLAIKEIGKAIFQKHEILRGDAVLVHTDHSNRARFKDYFQTNPVLTQEAAQYLAERKPSIVGIDSFSVDNSPFPVHKTLLAADVLIIENLTNLASLAGQKFKFLAFPLKITGAEASPVRALAELYDG